jgi:hypothetical protein
MEERERERIFYPAINRKHLAHFSLKGSLSFFAHFLHRYFFASRSRIIFSYFPFLQYTESARGSLSTHEILFTTPESTSFMSVQQQCSRGNDVFLFSLCARGGFPHKRSIFESHSHHRRRSSFECAAPIQFLLSLTSSH